MTPSKLSTAGIAAVLTAVLAGSAAFAAGQSGGGYACLLSRERSNTHHVVTVCTARTPEAITRLRAADCDPAKLSDAAMRVECMAMRGDPRDGGTKPAAAG